METADLLQGLAKEISLMRVKLRSLLYSPQSSPELVLQAVRTLSRMVDIQERINSG
jgi:ferredoxin-fold anticodon binding domain-containing protein